MSIEALDYRKAALLVIDMQNAFIHERGTLGLSGLDTDRLSAIVRPLREMIERFQAAGVPVIWTRQQHFATDMRRAGKKIAGHTSRRKQVSALANSWDEEIIDELGELAAVNPDYVITKHRFGAFHETRLDQTLGMLGTRHLFVTGATTNACVETSIREAYLRDYDVVAVDDCMSGVNPEWEELAKKVWQQYFGTVARSSEVLDWLSEQTRPRVLAYGHQLIMVRDIDAAVDFYTRLLGFTIRPARPLADGRPFTAFAVSIARTAALRASIRGARRA